MRIFGAFSRDHSSAVANDVAGDKQADYAIAVDDVARLLNPQERLILRQTGKVPHWFLADVDKRYEQIRR